MGLVEPERRRRYPFIIGNVEVETIGSVLEAAIESAVERVVAGSS